MFFGPMSVRYYNEIGVAGNKLNGWMVTQFSRKGSKDFSDFFHEVKGL